MANGAIVTLDISVLLWFSGLNVLDVNAHLCGPSNQRFSEIVRDNYQLMNYMILS